MGFNQELDLFCSIPVINWLIISGLVPLNYGADCKLTWWSSELETTYTMWDTSSRFLPCLVTAPTLLWLSKWRKKKSSPVWPPLPHSYHPLRYKLEAKLEFILPVNLMYNYIALQGFNLHFLHPYLMYVLITISRYIKYV